MNVNLLFRDRDHRDSGYYPDWNEMVKDLGLDILLRVARKDSVLEAGDISNAAREYENVSVIVKRVMAVPLTGEEIAYRHEVLKDCLKHESFISRLYVICQDTISGWERLGRNKKQAASRDASGVLNMETEVLKLLFQGITQIRTLLEEYGEDLESEAFRSFTERFFREFTEEKTESVQKVIDDLSFYVNTKVKEVKRNVFEQINPVIVLDVGVGDGLKFTDIKLDEFASITEGYKNPFGLGAKIRGQINRLKKYTIPIYGNLSLSEDAEKLEKETVNYVLTCLKSTVGEYGAFIDKLRFESAFYFGAVNLKNEMRRFGVSYCLPEVGEGDELTFKDLKEVSMAISQRREPVGNTDDLSGKILTVITGANQGGKSTFLRSLGIAQVMMQCGLFVGASAFKSGLYPKIFTHFTRREDSAMNSGKLDEELKRMGRIIEEVTPGSLVLLNESFATTTEKEGSAIAYDIVKALKECGVKVMTVTHLMSFARKMYEECGGAESRDCIFLSAERLENGARTFKMIRHEPMLSSFGLELYEKILGK